MGESDGKGWFVVRSCTTSAIKFAMAGTYIEMLVPISSILGLLILYSKNVMGKAVGSNSVMVRPKKGEHQSIRILALY